MRPAFEVTAEVGLSRFFLIFFCLVERNALQTEDAGIAALSVFGNSLKLDIVRGAILRLIK